MASATDALPSINVPPAANHPPSTSSSEDEAPHHPTPRPALPSRKSSGTLIMPRDQPQATVDVSLDSRDVRAMSPRRSSGEVAQLSETARRDLLDRAAVLQLSLQALVERVEEVRSEHERLEGGNRFLQSYIGELMQTSKITSSGAKKGRGRSGK
ncbi:hypothetical protein LTR48_001758 [Friedmanniomyces endolithicus]|uniref:BZIP transcription factor n=1 Tax=Rachicladosporium monterosium TaxID=1507873 RepID=A0ABR0LCZ8_9PEZI|nr:hypothetical protein LTR29_015441 [Friedmanniomyces endolithicus]KAK1088242.1 hypothetical protein LTR48_001758 [Friedmanniomyces endolithicus]KAK1809564.1 hypothetical protein LTR12_016068 [Friedmanniomyces endolithicus]KAK5146980.1 hypothetical protein LTR32_001519 [Rachicladosporium monterosium]